jgi:DNA ligase (NAD+)
MSEATLQDLISHGFIRNFKDIYHLSDHYDQLILIDGFGKKSVEKLLNSIEDSRNVKLENFIAALGIPEVGLSTAKAIASYCKNDIKKFISMGCGGRWNIIDGIGINTDGKINVFMKDNLKEIIELAAEMSFIVEEKPSIIDNPFNGKSICVTGKLNHFTRDSINEKITSLGAKTASSVTAKTDYLITNEASGSSKYKKAVELNVSIITEEEFLNMLEA